MGQARQRVLAAQASCDAIAHIDLARVAGAVQRLCQAASTTLGADCLLQAQLAQAVLARLGVRADLRIGYAAWRVGSGPSDVLSHFPTPGATVESANHVFFHAWLQIGEHVLDVTTNLFPQKARMLDAADGGQTTVEWHPDFLWLPLSACTSLEAVTAGYRAGAVTYVRRAPLEIEILRRFPAADGHECELAWLAYQARDAVIIGLDLEAA